MQGAAGNRTHDLACTPTEGKLVLFHHRGTFVFDVKGKATVSTRDSYACERARPDAVRLSLAHMRTVFPLFSAASRPQQSRQRTA